MKIHVHFTWNQGDLSLENSEFLLKNVVNYKLTSSNFCNSGIIQFYEIPLYICHCNNLFPHFFHLISLDSILHLSKITMGDSVSLYLPQENSKRNSD